MNKRYRRKDASCCGRVGGDETGKAVGGGVGTDAGGTSGMSKAGGTCDAVGMNEAGGCGGAVRIAVVVGLCLLFRAAVNQVQRGMQFRGVADLGLDMTDFPEHAGPWKWVRLENPQMATVTPHEEQSQASQIAYLAPISMANRCYQNEETGVVVSTHMIWTKDYFRIHIPEKCYPGNGFSLKRSEDLTVDGPGGERFPVRLLTFSNAQEERYVAYWFQYGRGPEASIAFGELPTRWARIRSCFGKDHWPPLVKVMLDLRLPASVDDGSSEEVVQDAVKNFTLQVQRFLWTGCDSVDGFSDGFGVGNFATVTPSEIEMAEKEKTAVDR